MKLYCKFVSKMGVIIMTLTEKQNEVIDLLIMGNLSKEKIAQQVGVASKTVYNWLNNNGEFKAELQRRTEVFNDSRMTEAQNKLSIYLDMAIRNIAEIANDKDNPKRFEANKYIVDRKLGNTTAKVEQTIEDKSKANDKKEDVNELLEELKENNIVIPKHKTKGA
jgi:transposase